MKAYYRNTRMLNDQTLTEESLVTLMCEVENIVNGRPITPVSDDPNDLNALTPNHLLIMRSNQELPPGIFSSVDNYSSKRWKQVQYLSDLFWSRWTKEYLPLLQQRQKWGNIRRNFLIGDVVLLVDNLLPRNSWNIGRIIQTYADDKGLVRSVQLRTKAGLLVRPINKLVLLEAVEL